MLFNSFEFIFVFLPITLSGFLVIGKMTDAPAARIAWLAAASLVFYGYWNINFLPIIAGSIAVNFAFASAIARAPRYSRPLLIVAITTNLAALGFYKYANFAIQIFNSVAGQHLPAVSITLPLGISFFTFTQIAYLVDVTLGRAYERNFIKYVLFVTYFPHLIAGPIMHHQEMMPQFGVVKSRLPADQRTIGLAVFAIGLFKKCVIADFFATLADPIFAAAVKGSVGSFDAWGGAAAYSLQIYFDFSGYCDMAIGISLLFGILLPFNFDAPYKAQSIGEFWHRWHITLSRFLRDYVYIPLGGNRRGEARRMTNLAVTMLVGGLWHGAGWTFIIWGALHGLFLIVNHGWAKLMKLKPLRSIHSVRDTTVWALLSLLLTQACVVVAWVFFRSDSLNAAASMLRAMSGGGNGSAALLSGVDFAFVAAGYLCCLVLPNVNELFALNRIALDTYQLPRRWSLLKIRWGMNPRWGIATAAMLAAAFLAILAKGGDSPFLYFQF